MKKFTKTVYSTDPDWKSTCPVCDRPEDQCTCRESSDEPEIQKLTVLLDRKGRKGKSVTILKGYIGDSKGMLKKLQQLCGTGGAVKESNLELQGDHRQKLMDYFRSEGHQIKQSGG